MCGGFGLDGTVGDTLPRRQSKFCHRWWAARHSAWAAVTVRRLSGLHPPSRSSHCNPDLDSRMGAAGRAAYSALGQGRNLARSRFGVLGDVWRLQRLLQPSRLGPVVERFRTAKDVTDLTTIERHRV